MRAICSANVRNTHTGRRARGVLRAAIPRLDDVEGAVDHAGVVDLGVGSRHSEPASAFGPDARRTPAMSASEVLRAWVRDYVQTHRADKLPAWWRARRRDSPQAQGIARRLADAARHIARRGAVRCEAQAGRRTSGESSGSSVAGDDARVRTSVEDQSWFSMTEASDVHHRKVAQERREIRGGERAGFRGQMCAATKPTGSGPIAGIRALSVRVNTNRPSKGPRSGLRAASGRPGA